MKNKRIRIPLCGFVELTPLELKLLDSKPMRRLKRIKQLAMTDEVYPSAVHTRFEHSIGVLDIATKMFDSILESEEKKNLKFLNGLGYAPSRKKSYWRKAIRLASLLHDVGHAPFSHASEVLFPTRPEKEWDKTGKEERYNHEDYTAAIIKGPLQSIIEDIELNKFDNYNKPIKAEVISSFFSKDDTLLGDLIIWRPIVSSQLDADRADYLLRDSYHLGVNYGKYDLDRIIETLTLGKSQRSDQKHPEIAFESGGQQAVEGLLIARYMMFLQVYLHHSRRAFDYHLTEAMSSMLASYGAKRGVFPNPRIKEELDEYLNWDDYAVVHLLKDMKDKDENAYMILSRQHDFCYFETNVTPSSAREVTLEFETTCRLASKLKDICTTRYDDIDEVKWYKFINYKYPIFIVKDDLKKKSVETLEQLSPLIYNLKPSRFRRCYASRKHEDAILKRLEGVKDEF